eukprot:s5696_g1.t1
MAFLVPLQPSFRGRGGDVEPREPFVEPEPFGAVATTSFYPSFLPRAGFPEVLGLADPDEARRRFLLRRFKGLGFKKS